MSLFKKSLVYTVVSGLLMPLGQVSATETVNQAEVNNAMCGSRSSTISQFCNTSLEGLTQLSSMQTAAQSMNALAMNNVQLSSIGARVAAVRGGRQGVGLNLSGLLFDDVNNPLALGQTNKAAAGDTGYERLGIFVNGNIGFGDRRATVNELGYNLDEHGATFGADYRITDNFLLGAAFGYNNSTSRYFNSLGRNENDSYTGAIYGSFFTESGFFIDGIFSGSHLEYDSIRNIAVANTNAQGNTQGDEFNLSMNTGYNMAFGGLTLTPQVRVDYTTTQVDALTETGGAGLALHIGSQEFESLQTAAGLQLSYALSLPWAIIVPSAKAEYIHEFENDSRRINARFVADPTAQFSIITDNPDRDYIVMNAGISAQFAYGLSAFANYDTVQAHSFVNNHNFSGGLRWAVSF
ncbi:autotransporter outer membrane beta-barrel domain-containing protein [Methylotuvimicrobium sp. KM2]|uniref:autotransporter outer membrane beta-barrel domain-containing protein n=1 Tax=Methylotuvimicrobium sp. KM2 TaxID=3133976 RepID=UPI0031013BF4